MAFDFRALRYFVAVAEELHFTRAAERLYIAQPALSEQIRRLEGELGVELLRRTTRKVELTAAGEEFLSRARRILAEADEALAEASRAARGETGRIRVATGATAGLELVPQVLRAFREARPLVHVDLRQSDWEDYTAGLRDGSADAAFLWLPFEQEGLSFATLHVEPRVVALAAGHPLAAERELRVEQFVDEPWPWVDTHPLAAAFWTLADYRGGAAAQRGPTIRSMEGMLEAVRAGLCVATVPRSQAEVSALPGIAFREAADLTPATLALAWPTAGQTPVVQALVEIARRVASSDSSAAPD
jgi:DNA-binding transcriptional LysR family regulator